MRIIRLLRSPVAWAAFAVFTVVGGFTYAEFAELDPNAEDNRLPERYELIRLGMSYRGVSAILGHPNIVVGQKISSSMHDNHYWADKQHVLKIVMTKDDRVVSKELSDREKIIAHEP